MVMTSMRQLDTGDERSEVASPFQPSGMDCLLLLLGQLANIVCNFCNRHLDMHARELAERLTYHATVA